MAIRGAELAYDVVGSGPGADVVLIHSALADRRMWAGQLPALTPRHRVLSLDLRGFGESDLPAGEFSLSADVADLMAAVGMTPAVVIGSSMGGGVAIDFALDHPEGLAGLVLVGAGIRGAKPSDLLQRVDAEVDGLVERGAIDEAVERELQLWLDGPGRPAGTVGGPIRRLPSGDRSRGDPSRHGLGARRGRSGQRHRPSTGSKRSARPRSLSSANTTSRTWFARHAI